MNMDALIQPAGPPPVGLTTNFVNPVNMAPNLVACNIILLVASVVIVAARIVSRTVLTDWRLGWDDCEIFLVRFSVGIILLNCSRHHCDCAGRKEWAGCA